MFGFTEEFPRIFLLETGREKNAGKPRYIKNQNSQFDFKILLTQIPLSFNLKRIHESH